MDSKPDLQTLTKLERDCALVIQEWRDVKGTCPSLEELAHELELKSKSSAWRLVTNLIDKGWAHRGVARGRSVMLKTRVPWPLDYVDVRSIADIALEAIEGLRRMMGNTGIALDLATRLNTALGQEARIEMTDAGRNASEVA